ncbi:carboxylesterase family protein [Saccharopolyspora indica]|uniref:carboxylesterase/lipase family protein n=1 Tax=Saccharopolyspora indica TaxID=1229659 RepID=UPI0022EB0B5E|nr:carboxylesterase family protein [Saccharopolyspora indica]MDA3643085.1 carboxylesterase family protein [Saccharopolyspora indica]
MGDVVRTESGAVRGRSEGGVAAFLGIPYAAPLHGALRFRAPLPAPRWDGVRDARAFGVWVPQQGIPPAVSGPTTGEVPEVRGAAGPDCLTLNIWTPRSGGGDALPVLVWLHGGGFIGGSANTPGFDGTTLARSGVVLVSVNYRVGYEGFGWVEDAPWNRGVLDQLAALRWVQDNIAAFGGDPDRVTVFGQSAGATSIVTLLAGGRADGVFHRGIAQSPGNVFIPREEARAISGMITDELGVRPTAETLATVPAEAIHAVQWNPVAVMSADPSAWTYSNSPFGVVLDGELLGELPWTAMRRGAGRAIDLICGCTAAEARMFTVNSDPADADPVGTARDVGLDPGAVDDYRRARPGITDSDLSTLVLSDAFFRLPAQWCARAHAEAGGRTFLYEFAWVGDPVLGAYHGLDQSFVFGLPTGPLGWDLGAGPGEFDALSTAMRSAWTQFAATGDPGWPRYRPEDRLAQIWDLPPTVEADPTATSAAIWERHHRTATVYE